MNQDFIDVQAWSGYRMAVQDPKGTHSHLPRDANDAELGAAVIAALDSSRFLNPNDANDLGATAKETYENWVTSTMAAHGYKSRRELFKSMKSCQIERLDGRIRIMPSRHERLEGWSRDGFTEEDYVIISADSLPADVGAALRVAFERCLA